MQIRPARITTRRLMVAVAILGLALGGSVELAGRRRRFLAAYREHALLEYEAGIKARLCTMNLGFEQFQPSLAEVEAACGLDAEERRLYEAAGEDPLAVLAEAGWKDRKKIPVHIDIFGEVGREGIHPRKLGPWLRREEHHRALRKKYQRAASRPWLPVGADPPGPNVGGGG